MRSKLTVAALAVLLALYLTGCVGETSSPPGDINAPDDTSIEEQPASTADEASEPSDEAADSEEPVDEGPRRADESVPEIVDAVASITTVEDYTPEAFEEWKASLADYGVELENESDAKKPFLISTNTSGDFAFGAVLLDSSYARDIDDDKVYTFSMPVSRAISATSGESTKTITHNITTLLPSESDAKYIDEMRWTMTLSNGGASAVLRLDTPDWFE